MHIAYYHPISTQFIHFLLMSAKCTFFWLNLPFLLPSISNTMHFHALHVAYWTPLPVVYWSILRLVVKYKLETPYKLEAVLRAHILSCRSTLFRFLRCICK